MEDLTGRTFGQFRIVGPLGEGGMAAVYKAYQPSMDRYVAVKVLPKQYAEDEKFIQRFEREAKVIARLQHPHILQVFDYGQEDGYTYLVMPFVEAGTLSDILKEEKELPLDRVRRIVSQIGEALEYAHSQGLVHRDIKPSNVLIDSSGNCLLTDFGIARMVEATTKITQTGAVIGTPAYMSPEQGQGAETIDHRSDIYSLGIMLYEMAVGRVPYQAETPVAVIFKHVSSPLPPPTSMRPGLPEALERVILKSLAKDPGSRFQSAGEMVNALRVALPEGTTEPDSAFLADDPLFAATVDQVEDLPAVEEETAAMPPTMPMEKTKKVKKPKPPREKKPMSPALKWGLIGVGGLVGLALISFLVMSVAGVCPPALPWCDGDVVAAADGGDEEPEPAQDQPTGGEDTGLTLVILRREDMAGLGGFEAVVNAFEEQNPDVDVVIESYSHEETFERFMEAASSGGTPQLLIGPDDWSAEFIWADLTEDVSDLQPAGMPDEFLTDITLYGSRAGLPFLNRGALLFRNTTIHPERTDIFGDFFAMAEENTVGGDEQWGAMMEVGAFFAIGHLYGLGGEIMDAQGYPAFVSEEGVTWLNMLRRFGELGQDGPYIEHDLDFFMEGRVGWLVDGTWNLPNIAEVMGESVAVDPWFSGMSGFRQKEMIYLNKNSRGPSKEMAREFIAFLVSPEGQQILFESDPGFIPVLGDFDYQGDDLRHQAWEAIRTGTPWILRPELIAYWEFLDGAIYSVVYEGADPQAELEWAAAEITPRVEEIKAEWGQHPSQVDGSGFLVCQVTDAGGIDDRSFNATAWAGLERAQEQNNVQIIYLESQQQTDYEININAFINEGCDLIVTVGFLLADATYAAAEANPDFNFAIIDYPNADPPMDNLVGITFDIDQAAFLAGYGAAGVTETGVVATFGGVNIPPVTAFMDGFWYGVEYYNQQHGTSVQVLGWNPATQEGLFTGNFESLEDGRAFAESLMDEGADVILPVAGPVGLGSAAAAQERGVWVIGVDDDWTISAPKFGDVILTSILKRMDNVIYNLTISLINGEFPGGTNYNGNLGDDGVGLADWQIPPSNYDIDMLIHGITSGEFQTRP